MKEYLVDLNAIRAAIAAGYSKNSAESAASRLLRNVKVRAQVNLGNHKGCENLDIKADYVLAGIRDVAERCKQTMPMAALKAYELLGKHLKLFTNQIDHPGPIVLTHNVPRPLRVE